MTYNQTSFSDMDLLDGFMSDDLTPYVSDSATFNLTPNFSSTPNDAPVPPQPAKVGGRFTRESERKMLQEETGLTKTQISNWLANARRRGKIPSSASSPRTKAMDIPPRPGTPAVRNTSDMDPLQRWVDSPPEDEPAAVTAIARAVASVKPPSGRFHKSVY
ncbi:hypothetical protein NW768_004878 [Fusarium equiseti]|uniref:KN homeodomain domain-containing protein n=1 Tax=Fusarium equiseti TaxID=61235 RepID=A0ABQ8RHI5_FUSEQ|nr:hypothetical protein NW768_004878 [Fusarium equiseti]